MLRAVCEVCGAHAVGVRNVSRISWRDGLELRAMCAVYAAAESEAPEVRDAIQERKCPEMVKAQTRAETVRR